MANKIGDGPVLMRHQPAPALPPQQAELVGKVQQYIGLRLTLAQAERDGIEAGRLPRPQHVGFGRVHPGTPPLP